jgi:DNA ligase-associated metallophosphoesterase
MDALVGAHGPGQTHQSIVVRGETFALLAERAIYWPNQEMLLVADAHFGKAATFRARGVPVPESTTAENLFGLSQLVATWSPRRLIFLGDFAHAREANFPPTRDALMEWRARHAGLEMILVRGNHDGTDATLPAALEMRVVEEPLTVSGFALCHHPREQGEHYVLAGHLHPAFRLSGRANERARVACYWFGSRIGVLPAFGAFTGGAIVHPAQGDRVYLAGPERVHTVPLPVRAR